MKRFLSCLSVAAALFAGTAMAQSTATPVVPGYNTTSGCPAGRSSCFVPYGAGGPPSGAPYALTSTGFQQVSLSGTAAGFTPPAGSTVCFIQTEGNPVRFRTDGVAPTASVGQLLAVGALLQETASLTTIKFIPTTGSATLDVDCYF